jgi:hypothetical protein
MFYALKNLQRSVINRKKKVAHERSEINGTSVSQYLPSNLNKLVKEISF